MCRRVSVGMHVCAHVCVLPSIELSVCGSSASSVWAMVITVLHCICRSQWSWTHCLSLHGSQQLCEFPGDIAVTTKPASCIFYQSQCVSVCSLSLFLSVCAADSRCVCLCVYYFLSSFPGVIGLKSVFFFMYVFLYLIWIMHFKSI